MSDEVRERWNVAKKFLRDLQNAETTDEALAIEDVICAEFAKVAELEAEVETLETALEWLAGHFASPRKWIEAAEEAKARGE